LKKVILNHVQYQYAILI